MQHKIGNLAGARLWHLLVTYRAYAAAILLIALAAMTRSGAIPRESEERRLADSPPTPGLAAKPVAPSTSGASRAPVTRTAHLVLFTSNGSYTAEQISALGPDLETALQYVQERTTMRLLRPINIMFDRRPEACGLDAVAYTQVRTIVIYVCPDTPERRAVNILAHELVHQLAHDHYGESHFQADLILSEGLATWGAGQYWLGDAPDFRTFVAANYREQLLPLATGPRADESAATLNQLYYEWAAFVEWIVTIHGMDALQHLYGAGSGRRPNTAPYIAMLGQPFNEVETEWQNWLK